MVGNKSFQLDPKRLRHYRELARKSQTTVAIELVGTPKNDRSHITTYQRLERTGKTTRIRAKRIAEILGVPLELLVDGGDTNLIGPIGPLAKQIKDACQRLYDSGEYKALLQKEQEKDECGLSNYSWFLHKLEELDNCSVGETPVTKATLEICDYIERHSFTGIKSDKDNLLEFLGIEKDKWHDPIMSKGLWLIKDSSGNAPPGQIFHGLEDVFLAILDTLEKKRGIANQAHLTMDDYVFRLAFFYEFEYRNFIIEITRCTASPDNRGIQFARPTVIQDWLIIDKLEKISQEYAWSTEMLGEETTLAEDLIFRIQSMTQTHEQTEPTLVTGKYSISDISEDSFRPRREGGLGDKIAWHIQLNLIEALKEHLTILLEKPGRWVNHRDIEGALYLMNASDRSFCTYRVDLVKQNDDGEIAVCKLPKSARIQLSQFTDELIKSKGEHP